MKSSFSYVLNIYFYIKKKVILVTKKICLFIWSGLLTSVFRFLNWILLNKFFIFINRLFVYTFCLIYKHINKYKLVLINLVIQHTQSIFNKYPFFKVFYSFVYTFVSSKINFLNGVLHLVLIYIWKKLIDFLFFVVYRHRVFIITKISNTIYYIFTSTVFIFLFINNPFFYLYSLTTTIDYFSCFCLWDFNKITTIFLSLFYSDNLLILINLLFVKIGLLNFFFLSLDEYMLLLGYNWLNMYYTFKCDNALYLPVLCSAIFYNFHNILDNTDIIFFNFWENPIFFFFGVLFFMTVLFSWCFFSYLGLYGIYKLNLVSLFLFLMSLLFSARSIFVDQKVYSIKLCSWVFLSLNVKIDYYFLIDTISFSFMLLTTTIAFFVFIYAFSYFRYEPLVDRFLLFILSFVISMVFLVISGNIIMLFLGWELIGFTSFCLINFWTTKTATLKSAFKAFTFNKVSDFCMFMFLVGFYSVYYTTDIVALNNQVYLYEPLTIFIFNISINFLEFISLMLIGAAFIKSAQLGGHAWLPDSMEAPVPASSLIHSATLVSAGIFLILRFNFVFDATQYTKFIIPIVGSLTAAYGGICAAAQSDIKKTLAYSTISHCGFLMVLCSTEMNEFTILYLYVHGFFKAGVFMCIGNVLRITRGYQDTRRMGGLLKYLPFEYFCAIIGVLNLAGLPFTFGFFIKHLLLVSLGDYIYIYYFVIFNSLLGAFSGLLYSYRIITYTFCDFKKGNKILYFSLNRLGYNSFYYTNTTSASTLSILFLFFSSYVIIYLLFKYLLAGNFLFSDFMNTTCLTNYYSITESPFGYLLNFSYINITVIFITLYLYFSKFRKFFRYYNIINLLFLLLLFLLLLFLLLK